MKAIQSLIVLLSVLLHALTTSGASSQGLQFTVNKYGLQDLVYNGFTFVRSNANNVLFGMTSQTIPSGTATLISETLDPDQQGTTLTYAWGTLHLGFQGTTNKLSISITVSNATGGNLSDAAINIFNLVLPSAPPQFDGSAPLLNTIAQPPVVYLSYSNGAVAFVNENPQQPITSGSSTSINRPTNTIFQFMINAGYDPRYNAWYYGTMPPIAAGASVTYRLSLRFGDASSTPASLAGDIYSAFANLYPFRLKWPDRRPIGMDGLSASTASSASNPRGWFGDPSKDYVSPTGMAQFRMDLLARADQEIATLKSLNAQGVIIWDIEGTDLSISYPGDPRQLPVLAPEMDAVADEFLAKYTAAGLRVGLTIRPQQFFSGSKLPSTGTNGQVFVSMSAPLGHQTFVWTNGVWSQQPVQQQVIADYGSLMLQKIAYARARWGATIFYLDSYENIPPYYCYALTNLYQANPDILMLPEAHSAGYFSVTAPYLTPKNDGYMTPQVALLCYSNAFSVVRISQPYTNYSQTLSSVEQGNILLLDTYYTNGTTAIVKQAYLSGSSLLPPQNLRVVSGSP
jgi:hypothetical protein